MWLGGLSDVKHTPHTSQLDRIFSLALSTPLSKALHRTGKVELENHTQNGIASRYSLCKHFTTLIVISTSWVIRGLLGEDDAFHISQSSLEACDVSHKKVSWVLVSWVLTVA
jgi:hypothetical protein